MRISSSTLLATGDYVQRLSGQSIYIAHGHFVSTSLLKRGLQIHLFCILVISCCCDKISTTKATLYRKSFILLLVYKRRSIMPGSGASGVVESMGGYIITSSRMQRKWTRSGVRPIPLTICLEWCTLPRRPPSPKDSMTLTNSQRSSFQTQTCVGHFSLKPSWYATWKMCETQLEWASWVWCVSQADKTDQWECRISGSLYTNQEANGFCLPSLHMLVLLHFYCIMWPKKQQRTC